LYVLVLIALRIALGCSPPLPAEAFIAFKCAANDVPCGNGCVHADPNLTCCAVSGPASTTSSYCTGNSCFPNAGGRCTDPSTGLVTQFCCGATGGAGSADCPPGQNHCGTDCVPAGQACCGSAQTCNEKTVAWKGVCGHDTTAVVCGYCPSTGLCISCQNGGCCRGDPCAGGDCSFGDACRTDLDGGAVLADGG
jgi:hypothetical protein